MRFLEQLAARWRRPDIAIFHHFQTGPYGGANQFLVALRGELERRRIRVAANLVAAPTRAALLNAYAFDVDRLRRLRHPGCRIVHRVDGPVGRYRGQDATIDHRIADLNQEFAAATVFQSQYSLAAHQEMGLAFRSPVVIPNAVDPAIFHAIGRAPWDPSRKIRLVSTSWSDNPRKGASTYKWIEEHLDWTRFEYTFLGRSPLPFDRIRTLPPLSSHRLGEKLRAHDIYVTASQDDPCSNALLEALACGLPALALRSGGHPELVADGGVLFDGTDDVLDKLANLAASYEAKQASIQVTSLAEVADRYLSVLLPVPFSSQVAAAGGDR
jgi:glycosyltransferase involved in cell wall biosynthesis